MGEQVIRCLFAVAHAGLFYWISGSAILAVSAGLAAAIYLYTAEK